MSKHLQTGQMEITDDLLALPVHIGDSWQLQAHTQAKGRYFAKLIGYVNHKSLIVMLPGVDSLPALGDEFSVRGFVGKKTYEFYGAVTSVSSTPYLHFHLDFPKQIQTCMMRRAIRVRTHLLGTASGLANNMKVSFEISEISATGAGLLTDVVLGAAGDSIVLNIMMPSDGVDKLHSISVLIRNVENAADTGHALRYGVEFVGVTDSLRSALQEYLCLKLLGLDKSNSGFV